MAFQILNKLKWTGKLGECEVVIASRGDKEDRRTVEGKNITELKKTYFMYSDGEKETFIPLHRVIEVRRKGKLLWRRREKANRKS